MHHSGYKSALARRACRYSDARPPRKTDGVLLESETPPHMRGKVVSVDGQVVFRGITPAYAGKSKSTTERRCCHEDHPRVCGEKFLHLFAGTLRLGSPPHMRGKACGRGTDVLPKRITPAYAGKSETAAGHSTAGSGSPLRMRGKVQDETQQGLWTGITPAYAGKRPN